MQVLLFLVVVLSVVWGKPTALTAPYNCLLPVKIGSCQAGIRNFFYNTTSGRCEQFIFGGCGGNDNRFQSLKQCHEKCACHFPPDTGPCKASIDKWYYDHNDGCCKKFVYGGCKGNGNNFDTEAACKHVCSWSVAGKIKPLGIEWGSGYDRTVSGEIAYGNYGRSFGGSGTIWIHKGMDLKSMPAENKDIVNVIARSGRVQIPGIKTNVQLSMLHGQGKSPEGTFTQSSGGGWQMSGGTMSGSTGGLGGSTGGFGGGTGGGASMMGSSGVMSRGSGGSVSPGFGAGGSKSWANYNIGGLGGAGGDGLVVPNVAK